MMKTSQHVGDIGFAVTDLTSAGEWLISQARSRQGVPVRLSNAYCVVLARSDDEYRSLMKTGITLPDGFPIVKAMRLAGARNAGRVRGPSFFQHVIEKTTNSDISHYFLGSSEETLARLRSRIGAQPGIVKIAGTFSPPFEPVTAESVATWATTIRDSEADIIWISLGTPKQDFAIDLLSRMVDRPCVAVGAAFDFYAGTVREAPRWVQAAGMEWLFRLLSEPRRLWRRYLIGNLKFLAIVAPLIFRTPNRSSRQ